MLAPSCHRASVRAVPLTVQAFSSLLYFFLNSCSSFYSQIVRETPSLLPEPLHFLLKSELPACDVLRTMSLLWQHSFSDHSMDVFLTFYIIKYPVCLCISLSLSLSHTHTHTHAHDCTMNACSPCSSFRFLKDRNCGCQSPLLYFHCPLLSAYLLLLDIVMFNFSIIRKAETCHYILFIGINRYTTFMV